MINFIDKIIRRYKLYKMNKAFRKRAKKDIRELEKAEKLFNKAVKSAIKKSNQKGKHEN
jgi:hypothetical protein